MKLAMITFAAAVGSANAYTTPGGAEFDMHNHCMMTCGGGDDDIDYRFDRCVDNCAASDLALATVNSALETANVAVATLTQDLATATTCMAATPGYSPVNFEDNCDMKECDQWTCETWCTCYSEDHDSIYTLLGCDTVDDVPCQCGLLIVVAPVVVAPVVVAPVVVAPHSYKLLRGTACTGRNELPSQPDINLAQAKRHCDGISSCVSFEMSLCDASGNCNCNFSTTCVESKSNGNYHNFDLYIKENFPITLSN